MLKAKIISSLEKPFADSDIDEFEPLNRISALKNEQLSFLITVTEDDNTVNYRRFVRITPKGRLADSVTMRKLDYVPSCYPSYPYYDKDYLRTTPGLYPDLLSKMQMNGSVACVPCLLNSVWVDINTEENTECGTYTLEFDLSDGEKTYTLSLEVEIINALLPEQELTVTQWFHCDCLATFYNVPVFSEKHWEIIENFARVAVKNGINMLLTPVFTPALDTLVGGERPTVQLVKIKKDENGYEFDYDLLGRWIDMCDRLGVKYFEISHFFTQWGACHAPKIIAETKDGENQIFGWNTDATGEEYTFFIRSFIKSFLGYMKQRGDDKRCYFHISDEPNVEQLKQYLKSKSIVSDLLEGYPIMDALSDYDFYKSGATELPIPSNDHIQPFIDNGVSPLWTYYCCGQCIGVSNRFFAMPGARTRFMGTQMYKYDIKGFLHWGYNFYYNQYSVDEVNPYTDTTGNYFTPSGDCFSVYPAKNGDALESIRIIHFRQGLYDMRAMKLAETLCGREKVINEIESVCGSVVFSQCVCDSKTMHRIREKINLLIKESI